MSIEQPKLLSVAFAENAGDTYKFDVTNTNETSYPNKATYETGFPAITMTDIAAGGIPFFGQDINGTFYDITSAIRYMQAGNHHTFNQEFANAINGYNLGAVVKGSDGNLYRSTITNNKTNPVSSSNWELTISSATNSTSTTTAANSLAVKTVADIANTASTNASNAMPKTGGVFTGPITVPERWGIATATTATKSGLALSSESNYALLVRKVSGNESSSGVKDAFIGIDPSGNAIYRNSAGADHTLISTANIDNYVNVRLVDIYSNYDESTGSIIWYRVYSNGWKEQGGKWINNTQPVINFLKPFTSLIHSIQITQIGNTSGGTDYYDAKVMTYDNSKFKAYSIGGSGFWYVCGY